MREDDDARFLVKAIEGAWDGRELDVDGALSAIRSLKPGSDT